MLIPLGLGKGTSTLRYLIRIIDRKPIGPVRRGKVKIPLIRKRGMLNKINKRQSSYMGIVLLVTLGSYEQRTCLISVQSLPTGVLLLR